ncbi:BNR repeat-containing protein [Rouxiella badensis]|uniref:BNR-4 repeat-containing protein n=1 Tax=Rouxiella badensis TaxID=1646377 RepID=UPI001D13D282|nr:BNR-4 repeat-containing protein [Rouxiella badensis]MCC3717990.1 BNR repeat-containing protein [Rouxiella badensis]MCC3729995.1 BNR repeat-containing protein [Rouxiella badensis]
MQAFLIEAKMSEYKTGNALGSTDLRDLWDNTQDIDTFGNSAELEFTNRIGNTYPTIAGLDNKVSQKLSGIDAVINSLDVASFTFTDIASGLSGTTNNQYFRVPQGINSSYSFIYYLNVSGTASQVAVLMGGNSIYELNVVASGTEFANITNITPYTDGSYYDASGVLHTDGAGTWTTYYLPVAAGQVIKAAVPTGSYNVGELVPVFTQLTGGKVFVSTLGSITSAGTPALGTYYCVASQAGYVALRVRINTGLTRNIYINNKTIIDNVSFSAAMPDQLAKAYNFASYADLSSIITATSYITYDASGNLITGKDNTFRVYYIPVIKGQMVYFSGSAGAYTNGDTWPLMLQMDTARGFVSVLQSFTTNGTLGVNTAYAIAASDGYICAVARFSSGATYAIRRYDRLVDYTTGINARGILTDITHEATNYVQKAMDTSGVVTTGSTNGYLMLPVKAGDVVIADGYFHSATAGTLLAMGQFTYAGVFVKALTTYVSGGSGIAKDSFIGVASQDGLMAIVYRSNGNQSIKIYGKRNAFKDPVDTRLERLIDLNGIADYTLVQKYEANNTALDSTGAVITDPNYRTVYVPVLKGDIVTAYTATGALASGETAGTGNTVPYMLSLDGMRGNPSVVTSGPNNGSLAGYQTVKGTAPRDGFMAVRLYAASRFWPNVKRSRTVSTSSAVSDVVVTGQFERLPVQADTNWDYNNCPYSQDNVVVANGYQYVVVVGKDKVPYIMQRPAMGGAWAKFDLSTVTGNPLNSPTEADGHNVYCIGVSATGYIVIAGNMHGSGPRAVVSVNPNDITAWSAIDFSAGWSTDGITYPHFVSHPDGTLQCYFRYGARHYLTTFIESTKTFGNPLWIVGAKADGTGGPYEQKYVVDNTGFLHVCWGYRQDASSALANEGLWYAKSPDKGLTWQNADGTAITPVSSSTMLHDTNTVRIYDAELQSGYVNQNGGCVDINGNYHTCLTQNDANGYTQIVHIWWSGTVWLSEVVTKFAFKMDLSSNLVMNDITRPVIGSTPSGKTFIFYHTSYAGLGNTLRAINVTTAGAPVDFAIASFDTGFQSMGFNVAQMLKTGDFMAPLAKGTANSASPGYGGFNSQATMLATIPMP